jgi:hypothetical protein
MHLREFHPHCNPILNAREGALIMKALATLPVLFCLFLLACGGGGSSFTPPPPIGTLSIAVSPASVQLFQDGTPVTINITATCSNTTSPFVSLSGLPSGVTVTMTQPDCTTAGKVVLAVTNPATAAAAKYSVPVQATSSTATASTVTASVEVIAQASATNALAGGQAAFMSTSFQVAQWSYTPLHDHPGALTPLNDLAVQHINIQLIGGSIPQQSDTVWDFTQADEMIQPLLTTDDKSPLLQLGQAPAYISDANGNYLEANLAKYAAYCANMVRYYNTGGFTVNGTLYKSPSATPIKYWGIHNEPNGNNVTPAQYVTMYNTVAQAMLAVDPTIKLVALELSDWGTEPQKFLPPLLAGVTQPIHVMATHYYGSCNQKDSDTQMFNTVTNAGSGFVDHVKYFRTQMDGNPATSGVPIWITENNVNADWATTGNISVCNPGQPFVTDLRGTSAYFAAWRPYVYSQLTKAGAAGLWHWSFFGGGQYGELGDDGSSKYLSFWVNYELSHLLGQVPMDIITTNVSEPARIEMFAAMKADGTRVIMVVNRDVAAATDNNGPGVPKTVTLDLSGAGAFTTVTLIAVDKNTNTTTGPTPQTLTPAGGKVTLSFPGYGVQFITLQ